MAALASVGVRRWSLRDPRDLQGLFPRGAFVAVGDGTFEAQVVRRWLPTIVIEGIAASPYAVHRPPDDVESSVRTGLLLNVVLEGEATVERGASRFTAIAGDVFLMRADRAFAYSCPVWSRTFRATVAEALLPRALRGIYDPPPSVSPPTSVTRAFLRYAEDLLADETTLDPSRTSEMHLEAALVALEQGIVAEELAVHSAPSDRSSDLRADVLDHIEEHLRDRALTPRAIAEHFAISVRSLHNLFAALPETAAERIRRRRIEEATAILRSRDATTAELAGLLGFQTADTFRRAFQRQQGITPSEYRALRLEIAGGPASPRAAEA